MSHLGNCGRCKQWRYLSHGFCPECHSLLRSWRIKKNEEQRAKREAESQDSLIEQFASQLSQDEDAIWEALEFRGD